jgi:hypothetical protein
MPGLRVGDLLSCLTGKLQATEQRAGDHVRFEIFDDAGVLIARTRVSHSWRASTSISDEMASKIKRQLGLSKSSELIALVDCPLSRERYLDLAKGT